MRVIALASFFVVLPVVACSSSDSSGGGGGAAGSGSQPANLIGAPGASIKRIAIYQGVERVLMADGQPQQSVVPLVAGRDAMVRVFFATDGSYNHQPVTARLSLGSGDPIQLDGTLGPDSTQADLTSTVDFDVPGDRIGDTLSYSVALLQPPDGTNADNPAAHYPAQGAESVAVEGHENTLRIILVPYRYDTDGSGRVPDTSQAELDKIRQRFLQLYPISKIDLELHDPVAWSGTLAKDGTGWQALGLNLYGLRSKEHVPDDVYLYGMFDPAANIGAYCGTSCLLGVTLLNNSPPDTGSVQLRLALGVGFPQYAPGTAAHETGHAHGRNHANCGPGLDPQSIDQNYPYGGGLIGSWGYDEFGKQLLDPAVYSDIMGYCQKQWISDYNYVALFKRTQKVNLPLVIQNGPPTSYDVVAVDGGGKLEWGPVVESTMPYAGVSTRVIARHGTASASVEARFFPYDHMAGGWLFVPRTGGAPDRIQADVPGIHIDARR